MAQLKLLYEFLEKQSLQYKFGFSVIEINRIASECQSLEKIQKILSSQEFSTFANFKIFKRKIEWLSGRIAAKQAFIHYLHKVQEKILELSLIEFFYGKYHEPYLLNYPHLHVSISHSHQFAVAVIADFRIGIDLEKVLKPEPSLLQYFFSTQEQQYLQNFSHTAFEQEATILWTRKEAISKLLKLGGNLDFREVDTMAQISLYPNIHIFSCTLEEYCLSLAMEQIHE